MSMLEVKDLQVYYGVIQALKGISFHVEQGEVIALIGANGAGKTTTLQTLTGIIPAKAGSIIYEGKNLTKTPAHKIVEMGMAHVPEGRRDRSEPGNGIQKISSSERTYRTACRYTLRWRAADARNGTCADEQTEDHSDG